MENPAIEGEVDDRLDCSASIAIDLPPGIVASGGRSKLMGNVDYSVWRRTGDIAIRSGSAMIAANRPATGERRNQRTTGRGTGRRPARGK